MRQVSRTARSSATWGDQSSPSQAPSRRRPRSPRIQSIVPRLSDRDTRRLVRTTAEGQSKSAKLKAELEQTCSSRSVHRVLSRCDFLQYSKIERTLLLTARTKPRDYGWRLRG
uniref:Uncharacterized protein n=1 Tax=Hyaloperonospora arabidopsidis (strain Emoy2) TaxID=559515 RepID=M4BDM5_HYAAE